MIYWVLAAVAIITGLAGYAIYLLVLLRKQTLRQQQTRAKRVEDISLSIRTIAQAIFQQQCDLSEGSIRLCILLDALPVLPQHDYKSIYPALHTLYARVKDMPTHTARAQQDKRERMKMDLQRGEWEAELESSILPEVERLQQFSV